MNTQSFDSFASGIASKSCPIALTIAGSDSGGGAGIQADLKTMSALGVYGASVITAITAQNTRGVRDVHEIPESTIISQIETVFDDLNVSSVKIGMLSTSGIIAAVSQALKSVMELRNIPIVLDPVMVAKSGDSLLHDDAVVALKSLLLPQAFLLTPNIPEAAALLDGNPARSDDDMIDQANDLMKLGPKAILMKGGHAQSDICRDFLVQEDGSVKVFEAMRVNTKNTHGTGCTLSAAIASNLAKGMPLNMACENAHGYLHKAILAADHLTIGSGHGPVHHFHDVWV